MADDVVYTQLPIMVRRPRVVWPGLDRMDLHRQQIAGDGNCLFASLADQLYGTPARHHEIREAIINHMRSYRPLFEHWAIKDDIQQKRATRAATHALRNTLTDDGFEEYLAIMARPGTYGGEPELVAFVQAFDQDVLVHLPRVKDYPESYPYTNEHRLPGTTAKPQLHLCYGGDEVANAHYDSARRNTPHVVPIIHHRMQITRDLSSSPPASGSLSARAIRHNRSDLSKDMMHDLVVKGSREVRGSLDLLNEPTRARSPSVTSSHHSSSSKRSFDDDADPPRASKRADRRKSTRSRAILESATMSTRAASPRARFSSHSGLATPASTQESDTSTEPSDHGSDGEFVPVRQRPTPIHSRSRTPEVRTSLPSSKAARRGSGLIQRVLSNEDIATGSKPEARRSSLRT